MKCPLQRVIFVISVVIISAGFVSGFEMQGFMNVDFRWSPSEQAEPAVKNGSFSLGQLDYFLAYNLSDRLDVLSEIVFEAPEAELLVDAERVEIGYSFGDLLNIRLGRFHTPLGYYSNLYHHGRRLDSTIGRPLILEFEDEGGLVPAHIVGLWARGSLIKDFGTVKYNLAISNGQKINADNKELVINMAADDNKEKALLAGVVLEPAFADGFGLGGSVYSTKVNGYTVAGGAVPTIDVDQTIIGLDLYYDNLPYNIIAEYYLIQDIDKMPKPEKTYTAAGYFLQASYEIGEKVRPYARFDGVAPEMGDPYTGNLFGNDKVVKLTCGIQYNLSPSSSLKLETGRIADGPAQATELALQWAFNF